MKKTILAATIVVLALAIVGVGSVLAQGNQPPAQRGWMHDYAEKALAAQLGLTEQQVEEQFAAGKTMYQIALDNGIEQADLTTFFNEVHQAAFAKAVEDGVISQEQADWMLQRMQTRGGYGSGNCIMNSGSAAPSNGTGYGAGMMQNGGGRGPRWGQVNP